MKKFIILLANSQRYFIHALRIAIFITLTVSSVVKDLSFHADYVTYTGMAFAIAIGTMILLGIWFHKVGLIGGLLLFIVSSVAMVLLTFQINPDHLLDYLLYSICWFLILTASGLICASDSAKQIFRQYVLRMSK